MRTPGGASGADVHAWIVAHRPELKGRMLFITGDTVNENTMKALQSTGVPYHRKTFSRAGADQHRGKDLWES